MKQLLIIGALLATTLSFGQKDVQKYAGTITAADLKAHLTVIASDEMEGRDTGSEGQKKAGRYLIEQYKKLGIPAPNDAPGYMQPVSSDYMFKAGGEKLPDSENIVAFIEGSELPGEIVVVSAHYDHVGVRNGVVYNGADDDGTGTSALLEIAQALQQAKKDGKGPKRSVLILHCTGEEHGLYGSQFYSEHPLFPLEDTVADVNIDMVGRHDEAHNKSSNYVYVIGSDYLSTDLYNICEKVNYGKLALDYTFNDRKDPNRFYYRSDHYNFGKNGVPAVFLFTGVHEDYHKPGDDVDKIEFDAFEKRARYAFAIVWELANRDGRPRIDRDGNGNPK